MQPGETVTYHIPDPNTLTMGELDEVMALTGVDVMNPDAGAATPGRVIAALVCWQRSRDGETGLTVDAVYRTLRMGDVRMTRNPTPPAPTA